MLITLHRSPEKLRGTSWRPVEHEVEQRRHYEVLHWMPEKRPTTRRKSGTRPGTYRKKHEKTVLSGADMLLAGANEEYTEARIEDQYKRGKFIEGFVFVRALSAFVHEDEVEKFETKAGQIGPGAIIAKGAEVEEDAVICPFVELERGAKVLRGAFVGPDSVIRKGAVVGEGSHVDARSYIGQFATVGYDVRPHPLFEDEASNSMLVVESKVNIYPGVRLGQQDRIGKGSQVMYDAWVDDNVHFGRNVFIGPRTNVGEMTRIGDNCHIAENVLVGAESQLGRHVRVGPRAWLLSPTHAEEGTFIPGPEQEKPSGLPTSMFDALDARFKEQ